VPAAASGGFLADIFAVNERLRQQVSPLSSTDFQAGLVFAEVTATPPAAGGDIDRLPSTQLFKDALLDLAIDMSGAKAKTDVVMVKWRSENAAPDGVTRVTIFNIGFRPETLHTEFIRRAKLLQATTVGGLGLYQSGLTVLSAPSARGFRFYVPIPPGWTDEQLCEAMIMQGGLDPDHVLSFGADLARNVKVSAPSGDLFFTFAPGGCLNHGSEHRVPITQPPSRMFVKHPVTGVENHLQIRKAGACKDCWAVPGRHQNGCPFKGCCKMCLELWLDMPAEGRRHACGQGHLSKPKEKSAFDPGAMPAEAPPPSPLAARIKKIQLDNIAAAKAKRKREQEPEPAPPQADPTPAQAAEQPSTKAPRTPGNQSPGGVSPTPSARVNSTADSSAKPRSARAKKN
jgi:hypothetical protein